MFFLSGRYSIANGVLGNRNLDTTAELAIEGPGSRNRYGEWQPGAEVSNPIRCVTVPLTGEARVNLPAGVRPENVRQFWLVDAFSPVETLSCPPDPATDNGGARLVYDGVRYRIISVERWFGYTFAVGVRGERDNA